MSVEARAAAFFSMRFMFFFCALLSFPSGSASSPPTSILPCSHLMCYVLGDLTLSPACYTLAFCRQPLQKESALMHAFPKP